MALVYLATNRVNGKQYVGFTSMPLAKRMKGHRTAHRSLERPGCRVFNRALRKHGWDSFAWSVLFEGPEEDALAAERAAIADLGTLSPGGYNLTNGGEKPTFSPESKRRLSESLRNSDKQKSSARRTADRRRGVPQTPARAAQLAEQNKSPARRLLSSATHKGVPKTRSAVLAAARGRRSLPLASAVNVKFLLALGAEQRQIASWVGVDQKTVCNINRGQRGWVASTWAEFYCPLAMRSALLPYSAAESASSWMGALAVTPSPPS